MSGLTQGVVDQDAQRAIDEAIEEIVYEMLSELAGIDTHDTDLRDHPKAWEATDTALTAIATLLTPSANSDANPS